MKTNHRKPWVWFAFLLFVGSLRAGEPIVTVGKPPLEDIAFSPDGRELAALRSSDIEFLDATTFKPTGRIVSGRGREILYSPDGQLLAVVGARPGIQLWVVATRTLAATIEGRFGRGHVAFSPDGKTLAYALWSKPNTPGDAVYLWDIAAQEVVRVLANDPQPKLAEWMTADGDVRPVEAPQVITSIAFHPNGRLLAVGSLRSTVALWDVETGTIVSYIDVGPRQYVRPPLRFNGRGNLLMADTSSGGVLLWDIANPKPRVIQRGGGDPLFVMDSAFTPDDRFLLLGYQNGDLRIVDVTTLRDETRTATRLVDPRRQGRTNAHQISRIAFDPSGRRFATQLLNSHIVVWKTEDFSIERRLYGWAQTYAEALYLPKIGRVVTGTYTPVLHIWDAETGRLLDTREFWIWIDRMIAAPDGSSIAVDVHGDVQVWDLRTMRRRFRALVGGYSNSLAFSRTGKYLARHGWRGTFIWDPKSGERIQQLPTGDGPPVVFTPNERQIVAPTRSEDGGVAFWDVKTGEVQRTIHDVGPVAILNGNVVMARLARDVVEVVRLPGLRLVQRFPAPKNLRSDQKFWWYVRFSPTGKILTITDSAVAPPWLPTHRFYLTFSGQSVGTLQKTEMFRIVAEDAFIFVSEDENTGPLGLYEIGSVLTPLAVDPSGSLLTQWGRVKRAELLQNYPNPFNPETWIPFRLGRDSRVRLTIYTLAGEVVRRFDLGALPPGSYTGRDEALHWDGRTESGEPAASGVYIAEIEAGSVTDGERMILAK